METGTGRPIRSATVDLLIAEAAVSLDAAGVGTPRLDAELLLAAACGVDRTALYVRSSDRVTGRAVETFRTFLARRLRREPLQYILGRQEFWSLELTVTPDVLIPRPETERLVELALGLVPSFEGGVDEVARSVPQGSPGNEFPGLVDPSRLKPTTNGVLGVPFRGLLGDSAGEFIPRRRRGVPVSTNLQRKSTLSPLRLCDVGAGSGCIAVALAHELPNAAVWALDISMRALAVAELNAQRLGVAERVRFLRSDLFAAVAHQRFNIIVANPPYLSADDFTDLQPELSYEPQAALDGGADGLSVIRRLLAAAPDRLVDGGWLLMEIGCEQAAAVERLARAAGFHEVSIRSDYAGLPRVLLARR